MFATLSPSSSLNIGPRLMASPTLNFFRFPLSVCAIFRRPNSSPSHSLSPSRLFRALLPLTYLRSSSAIPAFCLVVHESTILSSPRVLLVLSICPPFQSLSPFHPGPPFFHPPTFELPSSYPGILVCREADGLAADDRARIEHNDTTRQDRNAVAISRLDIHAA